jgi:hypothetical protein
MALCAAGGRPYRPGICSERGAPVPVFMVERFLPDLTPDGVRAQMQRERALAGLRHLRTTYLPGDDLCFSLFEAPSLIAVTRANDRAGMTYARITEAYDVTDESAP